MSRRRRFTRLLCVSTLLLLATLGGWALEPLDAAAFPLPVLQGGDWAGWRLLDPPDAAKAAADATPGLRRDADAVLLAPPYADACRYRCDVPQDRRNWLAANRLSLRLQHRAGDAPVTVRVGLTGIDTELMLQEQRWTVAPGERQTITVDLGPAAGGWEAVGGHGAVWNGLWRHYVRQLHLELQAPPGALLAVEAVTLDRALAPPSPPQVQRLGSSPAEPTVGDLLDLRLDLSPLPDRVFGADLPYRVVVDTPDGQTLRITPFLTREYALHAPADAAAEPAIRPAGQYHWAWRLYLREAGAYRWQLYHGDQPLMPAPDTVTVRPRPDGAAARGFLRLKGTSFAFEDGGSFYPIGLNACWPADPVTGLTALQQLPGARDLRVYDLWFARLAAAGLNTSQIWMTPYWTALEWRALDDGYGGVGVYSPRAAWMLDQVLASARRHGIHLLLTTRNHQQFWQVEAPADALACWAGNPWNVANGGPLHESAAWFSDPAALAGQRDHLGYLLARWGQDPQIIAFNLLSEMDNAGAGKVSKTPALADLHTPVDPEPLDQTLRLQGWWDRTLADARDLAPQPRLLSAGNCRARELLAMQLWQHPTVPMVLNDWYITRRDCDVGAAQYMHFAYKWLARNQKPIWITETAFDSGGERLHHTRGSMHEAYWASSMLPMAGTVMYWWWNQIVADHLETLVTPVARFWDGEDRQPLDLRHACGHCRGHHIESAWSTHGDPLPPGETAVAGAAHDAVRHIALVGARSYGYVWREDDSGLYSDGIAVLRGVQIPVPSPQRGRPGPWVLEFWDPWSGRVIQRSLCAFTVPQPAPTTVVETTFTAPDFQHDIAWKIYLADPDAPPALIDAPRLAVRPPLGRLIRYVYAFSGALPADAAAALAQLTHPDRRAGAPWRRIDDQHNPWNRDWPIRPHVSDYQGVLHLDVAGAYRFAIDCDEAGFLWVDDQLVLDWPGNHDPSGGSERQHSTWERQVCLELQPGDHRVRFAVFNSAGAFLARLAWAPPDSPDGDAGFTVIPPSAWYSPATRAALAAGRLDPPLTAAERALWPDLAAALDATAKE